MSAAVVTMGFFVCFCSSETSSVCSSSDTGLFTNDEGRQGNDCSVFSHVLMGNFFYFIHKYKKKKNLCLKRDREGSMGERPVAQKA